AHVDVIPLPALDLRPLQVAAPVDRPPVGRGGGPVVVPCVAGRPPARGPGIRGKDPHDRVRYRTAPMAKIGLDIDSTLHHYWPLLERVAQQRYGVDLPYEEQRDWGITRLEHHELVACVAETHSDENILAG